MDFQARDTQEEKAMATREGSATPESAKQKKRRRVKRPRGLGTVYKRGNIWWIRLSHGERPESSGSSSREAAEDLLKKRLAEAHMGRRTLTAGPASFGDLEEMLLDDMRANRRRSTTNVEKNILPRLRASFGAMNAADISYDAVSGYMAQRLKVVSPATVRYERAVLRRMFGIAYRAGRVDRVPAFPTVRVENARTGFASPEDMDRVIEHLPEHAKGPVRCLYLTGWRTGEVLGLEWRRVDFQAGTIRLDAEQTKCGRPRAFPFAALPALAALLRERRERTTTLERSQSRVIPWVFHLGGECLASFRTGWRSAVKKAGLPWLTPHDMRRSAARNLVRAGVPEKVVMDLCGWKTRAMFDRYNITSARDLEEGVGRLGAYLHYSERSTPEARQER
jgi:integrase